MDTQQKNVRTEYDVNEHLIDKVWEDELKGLRKEVVSFEFSSVVKASELSKCLVEVIKVCNLGDRKSNYLRESVGQELWIGIGTSVTPVDCYIEEFLKQMFTNETSKCTIKTKSSECVEFVIKLKEIEFGGFFCEQPASKMFEVAKQYKENGVKMFKDYPVFAQNYFNQAAKCLLSFTRYDNGDDPLSDCDITRTDFDELLQNINLNIAACLLKQNRYDDVLHVLNYSVNQEHPSEKAAYRLASAYFHLKQFENAKNIIERVNHKGNKDLTQLLAKVHEHWKVDHDRYSNMVKKMFA